jgi:hypothetical protein
VNIQYCSVDKIKKNMMGGACSTYEKRRGEYSVLLGKPKEKRPLGRPRRRWEDDIKIDLQKVGCEGMDWFELAQDRDSWRGLVNTVIRVQ